MTSITTTYKSNDKGTGVIVAKANIGGKVRQKTTKYNHEVTADRNHGEAAGNLILANALDALGDGVSRSAVLAATHEVVGGGVHRFNI